MLEINDLQYLPDGRSFLDCVGGRRFKVKNKIMKQLVNIIFLTVRCWIFKYVMNKLSFLFINHVQTALSFIIQHGRSFYM